MAASLAGVALAELLVAACAHAHGSALSVTARRCCGEQGCAAAALAPAPRDGLQLQTRHGLLSHDCARDADCLQGCRELCRTHAEHVGDAGSWLC